MKFHFAAVFLLCFIAAQARVIIEFEPELAKETVLYHDWLQDEVCSCSMHACTCKGSYQTFKYCVTFTAENAKCVVAIIAFGNMLERKIFKVNKPEVFCVTANGQKICGDFDFKDKDGKDNMVDGCVNFIKPKKTEPSCFKIPVN